MKAFEQIYNREVSKRGASLLTEFYEEVDSGRGASAGSNASPYIKQMKSGLSLESDPAVIQEVEEEETMPLPAPADNAK